MDITLPSGAVFNFGDLSQEDIAEQLTSLRSSNPELFQEATADEGPPDPLTTSIADLKAYYKGRDPESEEPDFSPTIPGQITDVGDRWKFGKADTTNEKEDFLTATYGPGSFGKDRSGRYYLKLDNISPEIRAEKNLRDSGTMWFDKPGGGIFGLFDMPDVVDFAGKYRGELVGGTAAALAAGPLGLGLFSASMLIGLGAGAGKGLDELQEIIEGTQRQSPDEIYGDIATAAAWNSLGNFIVGGALKLIGRAIKGPGNPDAQVISDLMDRGMTAGDATAAAVQMQRTATRDALKAGARPTISDATGKSILGRLQAIHEGIFPNKTAARSNRKYVEDLIEQYKNGQLSDDAFGAALDQNARDVSALITNTMKDPNEAVKLANQQLRDVIEEEMNLLKRVYTTGDETAAAFQNEITRMVRLWQNNNKELYNNASTLMDDARLFKSAELREVVANQLKAPLAKEQGLANNPVYQYILNKTDDYTLGELQTLRSAVQNSRSGSLVGDVTDYQLKGLSNKIDEMFELANFNIQEKMAKLKEGLLRYGELAELGVSIPPGRNAGQFLPREEARQLARRYADGFDTFKAAQKHYKDGAEVFKTGAMNMLNQNIKEGFFADLSAVAEAVIQKGKPELLKNYLKAVTPEETVRGTLQAVPETQWLEMAAAATRGDITEVNRLLGANFPELAGGKIAPKTLQKIGLSFKPPKFLETLPANDPYRRRVLGDLAETFTLHAQDSAAAATGISHRNISRQMLANTWMKMARQKADDLGVLDPSAFRRSFDELGKEVQDVLFGQTEARRLNSVLKDFALVAPDQVKGGFRFGTAAPDTVNNSNMRTIVSNLQADVAEAQAQSTNALFQAVKSGRIVDADSLVQAATKDPKLLDDLLTTVPNDALNQPFGLRDATMFRIMKEAFPKGVTEDAVIRGDWQAGMMGAIANLNQRGSLTKILGRDTVQDLVKLTKLPVGDQALKGKGGLSSALYAATIGMRVLAEPVSGLASVAGIYTSGRVLRSKLFLQLMTRPNIRATELKRGIKALTDDILAKAKADGVTITRKKASAEARKQLGNLSVLRRRFTELANAEARLMGLTEASDVTGPEERRAVGQTISRGIEAVAPVVQDIQQQLPAVAAQAQQGISPSIQALRDQVDPRVQAQRELLGVR